jgi:photosystem II stability/assembly factor-like uncharacterized protein
MGLAIVALTWPSPKVSSTEELETEELSVEGDSAAREAFRLQLLQDENGQIPTNAWYNAYEETQAMPFLPEAWDEFQDANALATEEPNILPWVAIGPGNIGGRTRSLVIHPATPNTMWLGSVSGGVWKTTNGGTSWSPNTDFLSNLAVNCMAIDPAHPNTLYAGTGEGFPFNDARRGFGIFKTTDGGDHWDQLTSTIPTDEVPFFRWVNRLAISPANPQLVLAATQFGLARSQDGGNSWAAVLPILGVLDVAFRPTNSTSVPDVPGVNCMAGTAGNGAYYSINNGETWQAATGLSPSLGRVELAYSRSDSTIVYALVPGEGGKLYRSTNGGIHFDFQGAVPEGTGVGNLADCLWVDPTNPGTVIVGGQHLWRNTQGGTGGWTAASNIHDDHHLIVAHPGYNGITNKTVYGCNDGGIYQITNVLDSSFIWTALNNHLAITQFYGGAGNVATGTIIGGNQDNGTVRFRPPDGSEAWSTMVYGDGGYCAADQTDPNYFYGEQYRLQLYRSTNGGGKAANIWKGITDADRCDSTGCYSDFIAPFVLDPNNPATLLAGGRSLWRSTNVKDPEPDWLEIKPPSPANCTNNCKNISAIAVAPGNSNIIWVGYGNGGGVYYTTNGMDEHPVWIQANNGLPVSHCTRITIGQGPQLEDPEVGRTVYVTFGGYARGNIWRTQNGETWTPIHHNLPPLPVYSLVISPSNPNKLYLGTELGVFATANGGTTWSKSSGGHPNAPVFELFWMGSKLVSVTHGRGMFTLAQ